MDKKTSSAGLSASPSIVNGVSAALQKLNCYVHIQSTQIKKPQEMTKY